MVFIFSVNSSRSETLSVTTRSSAVTEIARVGGRYASQGHSRSVMLLYQSKARIRLPISE